MPTTPTTAPTAEELAASNLVDDLNASFRFRDSHIEAAPGSWVPNPAVVEIIAAAIRQHSAPLEAQIAEMTAENERRADDVGRLLAAMGNMSYHPEACPITGRPFFMTIDGKATYGGPFDSYTIPRRDDDGSLTCERYDHDRGGWVDSEGLWLHVVSEETIAELDEKAASAEARATTAEAALSGYESLVGDLMGATGTDNIASAVKAAVAAVERKKTLREALQPVLSAFNDLEAQWRDAGMHHVDCDQGMTWGTEACPVTVGDMLALRNAFAEDAALQTKEYDNGR